MKRLEKVDMNAVNGNNNGNRGEQLKESIFRNISNAFRIKSIEILDNNEYIYDDIRNSSGNADDDDVFIDKEKELNYVADHFALSPGPSQNIEETIFTYDKVEDNNAYNEIVEAKVEKYYRR